MAGYCEVAYVSSFHPSVLGVSKRVLQWWKIVAQFPTSRIKKARYVRAALFLVHEYSFMRHMLDCAAQSSFERAPPNYLISSTGEVGCSYQGCRWMDSPA